MEFAQEGTGSLVSPTTETEIPMSDFSVATKFKISNGPYTSCITHSAITTGQSGTLADKSEKSR